MSESSLLWCAAQERTCVFSCVSHFLSEEDNFGVTQETNFECWLKIEMLMAAARAEVERWQQSKDELSCWKLTKLMNGKDPLSQYFSCAAYNM